MRIRDPPSTKGTKVLATRILTPRGWERSWRGETPRSPFPLRAQLRHLLLELLDALCLCRELSEQVRHRAFVCRVYIRLDVKQRKRQSTDGSLECDHNPAAEPPMRCDRDGREIARAMHGARVFVQRSLDAERRHGLELRRCCRRLAQALRDEPLRSTAIRGGGGANAVDSLPSHPRQSTLRVGKSGPPCRAPRSGSIGRETV